MDMTGRSGNGVRTGSQGGLLVREVDQAVSPVEDLDLGSGEPARDRGAPDSEHPDELPPLRKPLRERFRDRMRDIFGTRRQIVDDLLECAPVGPYAQMADEVLEQEQPRTAGTARRTASTR